MSRLLLVCGGAAALVAAAIAWQSAQPSSSEFFVGKTKPPEAAPVCPWREPEVDLKLSFPNASRYELENHPLSGSRLELAERLGRALAPDENLLPVYRIYGETGAVGAVLTRRVKGTHGAIEVVIATDLRDQVCGLRLQRLREPEGVARALENPEWLRSFHGKTAGSGWDLGRDIPEVPPEARASATAIAEGTRSALILLAGATRSPSNAPVKAPHH